MPCHATRRFTTNMENGGNGENISVEDRREHLAGKWKVFFGSLQWKRRTLQETMDAFREKSVHCNLQSLSGIQDPFVPWSIRCSKTWQSFSIEVCHPRKKDERYRLWQRILFEVTFTVSATTVQGNLRYILHTVRLDLTSVVERIIFGYGRSARRFIRTRPAFFHLAKKTARHPSNFGRPNQTPPGYEEKVAVDCNWHPTYLPC